MSIADLIMDIYQAKQNIKEGLIHRGLSPSDDFTTYADLLRGVSSPGGTEIPTTLDGKVDLLEEIKEDIGQAMAEKGITVPNKFIQYGIEIKNSYTEEPPVEEPPVEDRPLVYYEDGYMYASPRHMNDYGLTFNNHGTSGDYTICSVPLTSVIDSESSNLFNGVITMATSAENITENSYVKSNEIRLYLKTSELNNYGSINEYLEEKYGHIPLKTNPKYNVETMTIDNDRISSWSLMSTSTVEGYFKGFVQINPYSTVNTEPFYQSVTANGHLDFNNIGGFSDQNKTASKLEETYYIKIGTRFYFSIPIDRLADTSTDTVINYIINRNIQFTCIMDYQKPKQIVENGLVTRLEGTPLTTFANDKEYFKDGVFTVFAVLETTADITNYATFLGGSTTPMNMQLSWQGRITCNIQVQNADDSYLYPNLPVVMIDTELFNNTGEQIIIAFVGRGTCIDCYFDNEFKSSVGWGENQTLVLPTEIKVGGDNKIVTWLYYNRTLSSDELTTNYDCFKK